ncbi:Uncharacterized protein PITC_020540 [Penicillium italicum]|uniref:BTB domain-containing protein n=1 Tax=Penicillium italicum TaxID=40296 RepID=A0A0A2KJQ2_PENIT|nr:Uncharacterized protein PITC_020540 [Penicillium italicum]
MSETSEERDDSSFAASTLPLYHGPLVKIRIQPSNREYTVSKDLLCAESPVFSAMFKGSFRESQEQTATLEKIKVVLSVQSFEALLQWLYLRIIKFDSGYEVAHIKAAVKLARLAEMYEIIGIEDSIAEYIKDLYAKSRHLIGGCCIYVLPHDKDKVLGTFLREGHPARRVMAQAFVLSYLQMKDRDINDLITQEYPKFAADLLYEVRKILETLSYRESVTVEEPITKKRRLLAAADDWVDPRLP